MSWRRDTATDFLNDIYSLKENKSITVKSLLGSREYNDLIDRYSYEFIELLKFYNYSNVIVGDADGNVIYSASSHIDIGENVFSSGSPYGDFSQAVKKSINENVRIYSEYGNDAQDENAKMSLFVLPLVNAADQQLGFLVGEF